MYHEASLWGLICGTVFRKGFKDWTSRFMNVPTGEKDPNTGQVDVVLQWWQPELLATVSLATLVIVAAGSLYKIAQLRGGGAVVAESLGGTLVAATASA